MRIKIYDFARHRDFTSLHCCSGEGLSCLLKCGTFFVFFLVGGINSAIVLETNERKSATPSSFGIIFAIKLMHIFVETLNKGRVTESQMSRIEREKTFSSWFKLVFELSSYYSLNISNAQQLSLKRVIRSQLFPK